MAKKILIIDDSQDILFLTYRLLTSNGYEVKAVVDGSKAKNLIEQFQPDLILMDMLLPDKDGIEICQEIKNNPQTKSIPVIITTGQIDAQNTPLAQEAEYQPDMFLTKPFDPESLLNSVAKLIDR